MYLIFFMNTSVSLLLILCLGGASCLYVYMNELLPEPTINLRMALYFLILGWASWCDKSTL